MLDSKRSTETRQTQVITILKGSVGAARKVSANWSQERITCHSSNWLLFRSEQLPHDRFKYCERFLFLVLCLVPVRSLLSSIVVPLYHVNDKLLRGRGKGRGVPPNPFGGLQEFYQIKLITSEITLLTGHTFWAGYIWKKDQLCICWFWQFQQDEVLGNSGIVSLCL